MHFLPWQAYDIEKQAFREPVLSHDLRGECAPRPGERKLPVARDAQQAVPFHARDGLAHGGAALRQPFRDASAERHDALLFKFEDSAEVHLGCVYEPVGGQVFSSPIDANATRGP